MNIIKTLVKKYKDFILYVVFGVLTTIVNITVYWLLAHPLGLGTMPSTIVAWIAAVFFAYLTNRSLVFHSEATRPREIIKEIISFFVCRLATGALDLGCMFLFVDVLHWNDVVIKTGANILVILFNFLASKLVIFKHKKSDTQSQ